MDNPSEMSSFSRPTVASMSERRKAQNRLAQKNYRKRMREIGENQKRTTECKAPSGKIEAHVSQTSSSEVISGTHAKALLVRSRNGLRVKDSNHSLEDLCGNLEKLAIRKCDLHKLSQSELSLFVRMLEDSFRRDYYLGPPRSDCLLTLIQFNVFRALISNTSSLGFTMDWLQADAISPWFSLGKESAEQYACPENLRPTMLQQTVLHHPWTDLFPLPRMRDNLLLADGLYDEDDLCNDLIDFCGVTNEDTGLIVWGVPWDPAGWEVSEHFLRKWSWVVQGCTEIQSSTNAWRRRRGEAELDFWIYEL